MRNYYDLILLAIFVAWVGVIVWDEHPLWGNQAMPKSTKIVLLIGLPVVGFLTARLTR